MSQSQQRGAPVPISLVCVGIALVAAYLVPWVGLPDPARHALFVLVLAGGLWVTEAIPAFAVGLLIIALEIALLGHPDGAFADGDKDRWQIFLHPWASPVMWLFFGSFVLAAAAEKTGLDRRLAEQVLGWCGSGPRSVLFGVMLSTFVFSMFISNTATTAMMLTVLGPLLALRNANTRVLLLGVAVAANLGGMATIIGTPPNAIASVALRDVAPVDFARWLMFGLPPAIALVLVGFAWLVRQLEPGRIGVSFAATTAASWGQRALVIVTFAVTVLLWLTTPLHGVPATVVAIMPIAVLTVSGTLVSEDMRRLPWDVLLLLAGSLALGVGVQETGLSAWLVAQLPTDTNVLLLALLFALASMVLSNFISNTAAANMLIPLAVTAGAGDEVMLVVPLALSASASMCLPVSTPPNALAASAGGLQPRDFLPVGVLLGILAPVLATGWVCLLSGARGLVS